MRTVQLNDNYGYNWYSNKNIWAKGYLFDKKGVLWKNDKLIKYFESCNNEDDFHNKLVNSNGLFSIVIRCGELIMACVDRIRMFPLFYKIHKNSIYISDHPENFNLTPFKIKPLSAAEFLAAGYVTGKDVLSAKVFQIEAGQILIVKENSAKTRWYHNLFPDSKVNLLDAISPEERLTELLERIFHRASLFAENRTIAIPLSGGFDSRLIALMLKEQGLKNIVCFTYGKKNNSEAIISKKVADKLELPWTFIEYNDSLCRDYLQDDDFLKYAGFTSKHCSMPFLQDYFAIKQLKEHNLIDSKAVIMAGHSGDFIAGGHLSPKFIKINSKETLARLIYNHNFSMVKADPCNKKKFIRKIYSQIKNYSKKEQSIADIYQNWDLKERQAKFINNSTNVFNWFGYEHYLPFWDLEFMNYFSNISFEQKLYKRLYNNVLINKYFIPNAIHFKRELQPKPSDYKLKELKNNLKVFMPGYILRRKLKKKDWTYYDRLTFDMEKLLQKNKTKYRKSRNSFNEIIVQWFIQYLKKTKRNNNPL